MLIPDIARSYTLDVQEDSDGQYLIFPEEEMKLLDWHEGDVLEWFDNGDGSWTIRKAEINKVKIELEPEQIDAIVISELKSAIDGLERNLDDIAEWDDSEDYFGVFNNNPAKDALEITARLSALKVAYEYFGGDNNAL